MLVAALATADEKPAPKLVLDSKDYLFEPVLQGDKVKHQFHFKNAGTADLIIRRVDPSCHCTVGSFPHEAIKPGGEGVIELELDTAEKIGAAVVRATVYSNDTTQNQIGACTTIIEMKGEVTTCYRLMPLGAYFGPVLRGRQPVVREIRAPGSLDATNGYEITEIESSQEWLTVEKRPLQPTELQGGAKAGWALKVSIQPNVPAGDFKETITVHTNVKKQPTFRFPVVGTASGPIHTHEAVLFGPFRRGAEPERVIPLERIDNAKGLPIIGLEFDKTRLDVTMETVVEDVRTDLRIKVRPDAPVGPMMTYITIRLDLAEQPLLKVPVLGDITPRVLADPPLVLFHEGDKEAHFAVTIDKGKKLSAAAEGFDVKIDSGTIPVVHVTPQKKLEKGARGEIVLTTDVAGEETVKVPFEVR
jgi:hypothetical protein